MAADIWKKFEGTMATASATLQDSGVDYTPGTGRIFNIQGFHIYNGDTIDRYGMLTIGATPLSGLKPIPTYDTRIVSDLNEKLLPTGYMSVQGEVGSLIKYRLWGVEVDA